MLAQCRSSLLSYILCDPSMPTPSGPQLMYEVLSQRLVLVLTSPHSLTCVNPLVPTPPAHTS